MDLNFTSTDLTMSLDDFGTRIIDPAMSVFAPILKALFISSVYGMFTSPSGMVAALRRTTKALDARVKLQNALAPANNRTLLLDPLSMADVIKGPKTLFQDDASIAKQYREGMMGRAAGFDWGENTLMPSHTRGSGDAAYVVNTSTGITSGTATITVATGTGTILTGDVFTVAGC